MLLMLTFVLSGIMLEDVSLQSRCWQNTIRLHLISHYDQDKNLRDASGRLSQGTDSQKHPYFTADACWSVTVMAGWTILLFGLY